MDLQYSKFIPVGIKWGHYNIIPCTCYQWFHRQCYSSRATRHIGGLVVSHSTVSRVVVGLNITYLATIWRLPHFGSAAMVINVQDGVSAILVIVLAHISDTSMGHFKMIVFTNIAYFLGLVLLAVSAGFMKDIAARVFYGAAVLIALGEAGRSASFEGFLKDQCISERKQKPDISDDEKIRTAEVLWHQWWFLGSVLALLLSGFEGYLIFMISAVAIGVFSFIFWLGRASYFINNKDPSSSKEGIRILPRLDYLENLSTLCPVEQLQEPRRELYRVIEMIPYQRAEQAQGGENFTDPVECLHQAERVRAEKFWTLGKLKEEKLFFMKLLPWCPAFLVYSVVKASVNTFYIGQTDHWNSPAAVIILMNSKSFSNFIVPYLFRLLVPKKCRDDTVMQIGYGLTCCVLCNIAAWQVEIHRMSSVKHGSHIINIFWLLPQFCLAGFMEGLAVGGLNRLVLDQVAEDNKLLTRYAPHIIDFVLGIGKFITVLILWAWRQSWFQGAMKTSRLDKYYRFLTILSLANLMCYTCATIYFYANGSDGSQSKIVDDEVLAGGGASGSIISHSS
ncbi:protein NRT1/ PTR FAMILY 5.1-like [Rosa sericea]